MQMKDEELKKVTGGTGETDVIRVYLDFGFISSSKAKEYSVDELEAFINDIAGKNTQARNAIRSSISEDTKAGIRELYSKTNKTIPGIILFILGDI